MAEEFKATGPRPQRGDLWRHYKGSNYEVVALGVFELTKDDVVIYREVGGLTLWVRPLRGPKGFLGVAEDGKQRFVLLREGAG